MTLLLGRMAREGGRGQRVLAIKGVESVDTCGRLGKADIERQRGKYYEVAAASLLGYLRAKKV